MITVRSIDFQSKNGETLRSLSFKKRDHLDHILDDSNVVNDLLVEESICFKKRKPAIQKLQTRFSLKNLNFDIKENNLEGPVSSPETAKPITPCPEPRYAAAAEANDDDQLHAAATKLQKAYKSYRTRRNLADCAVVVEELWWKALDFAVLSRSSISFFDSDRSETAVSRWSRAKTRIAKLAKGLSKDEKAQQLALRHWLEVIDPRHRYGRNLHVYYDVWFASESSQPFFYWLDVGDGKEVNLETCPRAQLQRECVKYLGRKEREAFEVILADGKLIYKQSGKAVETEEGTKWIFVLSASRAMYVGKKEKGLFQHSSFLAGGAAIAAGRLVAHDGILEAVWSYSGHYRPSEENFLEFVSFLEDQNLDLTNVKKCPVDDDIPPPPKSKEEPKLKSISGPQKIASSVDIKDVGSIVPTNASSITITKNKNAEENMGNNLTLTKVVHSIEKIEEASTIIELSKPISYKWSTGAGPRIGCVREYPMKLQLQALEHVNLSPRTMAAAGPYIASCGPIPSPRPTTKIHLSHTLAYMNLASPRLHLSTTPK